MKWKFGKSEKLIFSISSEGLFVEIGLKYIPSRFCFVFFHVPLPLTLQPWLAMSLVVSLSLNERLRDSLKVIDKDF